MITNRRTFLKTSLAGAALIGLPSWLRGSDYLSIKKLCILHTNDMHSRIEAFPANHNRYPNQGGMMRLAAKVAEIRTQEPNVLLFDAGDIFQGTPYFNEYGGELELKLMEKMKYDAVTIGNHDFDGGITHLAESVKKVPFNYLNANYGFASTPLNGLIPPYQLFEKEGIKIGVFGIGIELAGLVAPKLYSQTRYNDPLSAALKISYYLKHSLHCDLVICLSHLGYSYRSKKLSDKKLALKSKNIDLIIGGHTHTFLDQPTQIKNAKNHYTTIVQAGWSALQLGQLNYYFHSETKSSIWQNKVHFLDNH